MPRPEPWWRSRKIAFIAFCMGIAAVVAGVVYIIQRGRTSGCRLEVAEHGTAVGPVTVQTADGEVAGNPDGHAGLRFLGIPYAQPPLGDLRWSPPAPPSQWRGVLNATEHKPGCLDTSAKGDEDCLYLNVYTPAAVSGPLKPVMLWFSGGCYETGGAAKFDGGALRNASNRDIVVVTVDHRLNVFGFLGHTVMRGRGGDNSTGNFGLQDQRMAMRWVRDNARAFGGDPNRLTIAGQSSGAGAVAVHLVAPRSFGLYHAAAMESGSFPNWISYSMGAAEANFDLMAQKVGCSRKTAGESLDCLLRADADALALASKISSDEVKCRDACGWAPVIDGVELADEPWILLDRGDFSRVPVLHGTCRDDGQKFVNDTSDLARGADLSQFVTWADAAYGYLPKGSHVPTNMSEALIDIYVSGQPPQRPVPGHSSWYLVAADIETDFAYRCAARRTTAALLNASSPAPVWQYENLHLTAGEVFVDHGCGVPFIWQQEASQDTATNRALAKQVAKYWVNFASDHNPNSNCAPDSGLPQWQASSAASAPLAIDVSPSIPARAGLSRRCDFWDDHWRAYGKCLPEAGRLLSFDFGA